MLNSLDTIAVSASDVASRQCRMHSFKSAGMLFIVSSSFPLYFWSLLPVCSARPSWMYLLPTFYRYSKKFSRYKEYLRQKVHSVDLQKCVTESFEMMRPNRRQLLGPFRATRIIATSSIPSRH